MTFDEAACWAEDLVTELMEGTTKVLLPDGNLSWESEEVLIVRITAGPLRPEFPLDRTMILGGYVVYNKEES